MAIYYARKNGNVNATDVWATTPSGTAGDFFPSFTNQDVLISNGFTVTLNVNTTVLELRNDTTGGATAGVGFILNDTITLVANIYGGTLANTTCVTFNAAGFSSATIFGNIVGGIGPGTNANGVAHNATNGTLNIIGNITGGTSIGVNSYGVTNNNGILNITGNVINGSASLNAGINNGGTGTISVAGNVSGGVGNGINNANGTVIITGNVNPSSANGVSTVFQNGNGSIIITGTVTGSSTHSNGFGVANNSTGSVTIIGIAIGGAFGAGANNSSTGTLTVTRAKGNGFGPGSVGLSSAVGVASGQNGLTKVYEIEYGPLGQSPTSGPIELITSNSNVAVFAVRLSTPKTLVDLNNATNLVPASGNVRSGITYNYGNDTGSCVIPNPNSVVYGVPVDNVAGSGLLSPVAVWNALTSSIGTSGSIGERLKNCSTVSTVGKQLEGVL